MTVAKCRSQPVTNSVTSPIEAMSAAILNVFAMTKRSTTP